MAKICLDDTRTNKIQSHFQYSNWGQELSQMKATLHQTYNLSPPTTPEDMNALSLHI